MAPRKLTDCRGETLGPGDVIRLPFDYMTGPGSPGVDLMVYETREDDYGLGVMTVTGRKAGFVLSVFPLASKPDGMRGLSADWLIANWDAWFVYGHSELTPIPIADVEIIDGGTYAITPRAEG